MAQSLATQIAAGRTIVLDGGIGTHLGARGNDITGSLWSAGVLRDNPDEVKAAHRDFFQAGAMVATTCSYQVTFDGVRQAGGTDAETVELLKRSVRIAREAASEAHQTGWVAAAIGPYGAGPGKGTEYDGDYGIGVQELAQWHRERIDVLARTDADVLLVETIPSLTEVEAIAQDIAIYDSPALLCVTVAGDRLRDGGDIREVARIAQKVPQIIGVGVNCCRSSDAIKAIHTLRDATDLPLVAYPNSGEAWDHDQRIWRDGTAGLGVVAAAPKLRDVGASIIGGCCRVSPADIRQISQLLMNHRRGPELPEARL